MMPPVTAGCDTRLTDAPVGGRPGLMRSASHDSSMDSGSSAADRPSTSEKGSQHVAELHIDHSGEGDRTHNILALTPTKPNPASVLRPLYPAYSLLEEECSAPWHLPQRNPWQRHGQPIMKSPRARLHRSPPRCRPLLRWRAPLLQRGRFCRPECSAPRTQKSSVTADGTIIHLKPVATQYYTHGHE